MFGHVERRNNDNVVQKLVKSRGKSGKSWLKKQIGVFREDIKAYDIDKDMVSDMNGRRKNI